MNHNNFISSNRENVVQRKIRQKKEADKKRVDIEKRRKQIEENIETIDATRTIENDLDQSLSNTNTSTDQENQDAFDKLFGDDTNQSTNS